VVCFVRIEARSAYAFTVALWEAWSGPRRFGELKPFDAGIANDHIWRKSTVYGSRRKGSSTGSTPRAPASQAIGYLPAILRQLLHHGLMQGYVLLRRAICAGMYV
jgi:hypothetical protein